MKVQPFTPFPRALNDSVDSISASARRTRLPTRVLAAALVIGLPLLQAGSASAGDQVLEIPQVVATPAARHSNRSVPDLYDTAPAGADATAGTSHSAPPPATLAANSESYPPDPNVGSISDYQNQPGENGRRPSIALGGGRPRSEPPASMTTSLIVGGILVGIMAWEIASAHHHHR